MKYVKFYTLGCKVNLYETEAMKQLFRQRGYEVTEGDYADVFVINTCTVTAVGDKKSRQMIRRAKKHNKNAVVMSCRPLFAGCARRKLRSFQRLT